MLVLSLAKCDGLENHEGSKLKAVNKYSFKQDFECFLAMSSANGQSLRVCAAEYFWRHSKPVISAYLISKTNGIWNYLDYQVSQIGQSFPYVANDFFNIIMSMYVSGFLKYSGLKGTPYESEVTIWLSFLISLTIHL